MTKNSSPTDIQRIADFDLFFLGIFFPSPGAMERGTDPETNGHSSHDKYTGSI